MKGSVIMFRLPDSFPDIDDLFGGEREGIYGETTDDYFEYEMELLRKEQKREWEKKKEAQPIFQNISPSLEEIERGQYCGSTEEFSGDSNDLENIKRIEKAFSSIPKHGIQAHAYKKDLNNLRIINLREQGKSYREIANQLGCSPNTVRNRLKKMGFE